MLIGPAAILVLAALAVLVGPTITVALAVLVVVLWCVQNSERDVTSLLIGMAILTLIWPSATRVAALGAAGTPSVIVGCVAWILWLTGRFLGVPRLDSGLQPIRWAAALFVLGVVASYFAAHQRALDVIEFKAADRGLIVAMSSCGMLLLAADGIRDYARLVTLIRCIVVAGAGAAAMGILTFTTGITIRVEGLPMFETVVSDWQSERSGFDRIMGPTEHPIEYSAVLAAILPLAIWAVFTAREETRGRWWFCLSLLGIALPMTVSRTAAVGVAVTALMLAPTWTKQRRKQMLILATVSAVVIRVAVPGLLGTIKSLFLGAEADPSVASRQSDYSHVAELVGRAPWFGRGFSTFLPSKYFFLDNQYLMSLVETGVLGLVGLLALWGTGFALARGARLRSSISDERDLAQSLAASIAVFAVTSATYDALSFSTARGLMFLLVGCAAALWRMNRDHAKQIVGRHTTTT
jgi:hypothetical protein